MSKHTEFPTKPDYEAKYKALEQAVKDALLQLEVKENYYANVLNQDSLDIGMKLGYERSRHMIIVKTGISA